MKISFWSDCVKFEKTACFASQPPNVAANAVVNFDIIAFDAEQRSVFRFAVDPTELHVIVLGLIRSKAFGHITAALAANVMLGTHFARL